KILKSFPATDVMWEPEIDVVATAQDDETRRLDGSKQQDDPDNRTRQHAERPKRKQPRCQLGSAPFLNCGCRGLRLPSSWAACSGRASFFFPGRGGFFFCRTCP